MIRILCKTLLGNTIKRARPHGRAFLYKINLYNKYTYGSHRDTPSLMNPETPMRKDALLVGRYSHSEKPLCVEASQCFVNRNVCGRFRLPYSEEFQLVEGTASWPCGPKGRSSDFVPASKPLPAVCICGQWVCVWRTERNLQLRDSRGFSPLFPFHRG